jgi:hypothetical protein
MSFRSGKKRSMGLLAILAFAAISGCGGPSGPRRVAVFGSIELDGKKVDGGVVRFLPGEGNRGPAANVEINRGSYAFTSTDGPWPGLYRVSVAVSRATSGKQLEASNAADQSRSEWLLVLNVPDESSHRRDFSLRSDDPEIVELK